MGARGHAPKKPKPFLKSLKITLQIMKNPVKYICINFPPLIILLLNSYSNDGNITKEKNAWDACHAEDRLMLLLMLSFIILQSHSSC